MVKRRISPRPSNCHASSGTATVVVSPGVGMLMSVLYAMEPTKRETALHPRWAFPKIAARNESQRSTHLFRYPRKRTINDYPLQLTLYLMYRYQLVFHL